MHVFLCNYAPVCTNNFVNAIQLFAVHDIFSTLFQLDILKITIKTKMKTDKSKRITNMFFQINKSFF